MISMLHWSHTYLDQQGRAVFDDFFCRYFQLVTYKYIYQSINVS